MKEQGRTFCMGQRCPVKKQCLRYTRGIGATVYDGTKDKYIRSCTNQKTYIQDVRNINQDSQRK